VKCGGGGSPLTFLVLPLPAPEVPKGPYILLTFLLSVLGTN
jgi:hypothetical protein